MTPAGWIIIILVFLAVLALIGIVMGSFWLLDVFNRLFNSEGNVIAKVLLFLPWVALAIWCAALYLVLALLTLGLAISLINDVRNWWHKGH